MLMKAKQATIQAEISAAKYQNATLTITGLQLNLTRSREKENLSEQKERMA